MGMSPSCHCICPGPPGPGSSSPTIQTIGGCIRCAGGVGARQFRLDISGATGTCAASYNGSFILTDAGAPGANACRYFSTELGINLIGVGVCPTGGMAERYVLDTETIAGPTRYRFSLGWNVGGTVCVFGGALKSATVADPEKLNCLTSHTLTVATASEYAGGLGCGGPRLVLPTSATITPV